MYNGNTSTIEQMCNMGTILVSQMAYAAGLQGDIKVTRNLPEVIVSTFDKSLMYHAFQNTKEGTKKYNMKLNLAKYQGDMLEVIREEKGSEFSWYITCYG